MDRRPHEPQHPTAANGEESANGGHLLPLLRCAHIFSSVVREILEVKLLEEASPLPLSLSQFHLLKLMSLNGRHQVGDLADFLGVSPPAATRNVDKLEGLGLVVRSPAEDDRRAILISVSPEGARLVERYEELKRSRILPILEQFEPEELDQFATMLDRFAVSVLKEARVQGEACLRCAAYVKPDCPVGRVRGGCPYQRVRDSRAKNQVEETT